MADSLPVNGTWDDVLPWSDIQSWLDFTPKQKGAWRGNPHNPAPTPPPRDMSTGVTDRLDDNRALHVRRDLDKLKNFTVTIKDIDECVFGHLSKMQLTVLDNGNHIKVPVSYASPEKWKSVQNDGFMRDNNGRIILPALIYYRQSSEADQTMAMFNKYLRYSVMKTYSQKNQYTRFSTLMGRNAPLNEVYNVVCPDHMNFNYKFIVWTEYIEQNNALIERINFETNDYWGSEKGFRFRTFVNSYTHTTEVQADSDRLIKTEFDLTLRGYLLPDVFAPGLDGFKPTTEKSFTAKKVILGTEVVASDWSPQEHGVNGDRWRSQRYPNLVAGTEPPSPPVDYSEEPIARERSPAAPVPIPIFPTLPPIVPPVADVCVPPEFQSYILSGNLTEAYTASYVNNTLNSYLSVWHRSNVYDTTIAIEDPDGIQIGFDDYMAFTPTEDNDNSALNVKLTKLGTYKIEMGSYYGDFGTGSLYVSPGPRLDTQWAGYQPITLQYISASNVISIGDNSSTGMQLFYSIDSGSIVKSYGPPTYVSSYGSFYSKKENRVFAMLNDPAYDFLIGEFDIFGNHVTDYPLPTVTWNAVVAHDYVNDKILLIRYGVGASFQPQFAIWNCNTRTVQFSGTMTGTVGVGDVSFATYCEVTNKFYVTLKGGIGVDRPTLMIDPNTAASSLDSVLQTTGQNITYVSESKLIVTSKPLRFYEPVSQTVLYSYVNNNLIMESALFDPCANSIVVGVDIYNPPVSGYICYNPTTFTASNFIEIQKDFGNNSYLYTMCYANSDSRVYGALGDFKTGSLWSVNVSIPQGSILIP